MKHLILSHNAVEDEGAIYLSDCVGNIEKMSLCDCKITSKGVQSLAAKIQKLNKPVIFLTAYDYSTTITLNQIML